VDYAGGENFNPAQSLGMKQVEGLFLTDKD